MKKSRKKILFLEFLPIGGSSAALLNHLRKLHTTHPEYELVVVTIKNSIFQDSRNSSIYRLYEYEKEAVQLKFFWRRPIYTLSSYLRTLWYVIKVSIHEKPKLIHVYHYMWSIYATPVAALLRVPVIVYLCDVWGLEPKLARVLMKFYARTTYVAASKYVYKLFTDLYKVPKNKTTLIYDGVDTKLFSPISETAVLKKLKLKTKKIVYFSRISEDRDIEVFIDMSAYLSKKYPDLLFYHWGYHPKHSDKRYYDELRKRVSKLGIGNTFKFISHSHQQDDVPKFMKKAFLSVIPARQFALPNVAIQSMMCGTPVIALNVGGNKEIIANNRLGDLVEVNSAVMYADVVEKYLSGTRNYFAISKYGSKYVRRKFDSNRQFAELLRVYEQLLR